MLKEIIFNKEKWFNVADDATEMNTNGKKWIALPASITIKKWATVIATDIGSYQLFKTADETTLPATDYLKHNTDDRLSPYIVTGTFKTQDGETVTHSVQFNKADIVNINWGG